MKTINAAGGPRNASAIILGCMRMPALSVDAAEKMIRTAVELGVSFFDSATCYTAGEAGARFGDAFRQSGIRREDVIIQNKTAVTIAWILRHPAKIQAIAGTMNPSRFRDICEATKMDLPHHEWDQLYLAAGKHLP